MLATTVSIIISLWREREGKKNVVDYNDRLAGTWFLGLLLLHICCALIRTNTRTYCFPSRPWPLKCRPHTCTWTPHLHLFILWPILISFLIHFSLSIILMCMISHHGQLCLLVIHSICGIIYLLCLLTVYYAQKVCILFIFIFFIFLKLEEWKSFGTY